VSERTSKSGDLQLDILLFSEGGIHKVLLLGPMPETVRLLVQRLVAQSGDRLGFLLTGGPGGCSYLNAQGQVWNWSAWDDSVELVLDGALKVGLVAIAAEREPGLAAWLPPRPAAASDCGVCRSGWLFFRIARCYSARSVMAWVGSTLTDGQGYLLTKLKE
jgi:hypothetical protein